MDAKGLIQTKAKQGANKDLDVLKPQKSTKNP